MRQSMDWGTLVQRRAKKDAPDQGGWNIFCTTWEGLDVSVPGSHQPLRGNGADGWFGWADQPEAGGAARGLVRCARPGGGEGASPRTCSRWSGRKRPSCRSGCCGRRMAYRRSLTGVLTGGPALFWNVRRG